jgi:glucoamylase
MPSGPPAATQNIKIENAKRLEMSGSQSPAPGWPGISPRWTSSAKSGVGTAFSRISRIWYTISHGILDEIYYPRIDQACTRDMGMLIADGNDYFSEEKRQTHSTVRMLAEGVPAFHLENTCTSGVYRMEKEVFSDPERDVVLQQTRFVPLKGEFKDYHVAVLLAPHLGNQGAGNTAWTGDYKGIPMLFAQHGSICLALACTAPWKKRSVGFVGSSDGWQDMYDHKEMQWEYDIAENGNVALTGEIDVAACQGNFTLALGFGTNPFEAGLRARASLSTDYAIMRANFIHDWQSWQANIQSMDAPDIHPDSRDLYHVSTAVLRTHEATSFAGGLIASLSIPWGFDKGDDDLGGYHLVWPRDLVESAGGLLAAGSRGDVKRVIDYLATTQENDGHWPQNMWLDGRPYWEGIQMDETAFPILLIDLARREKALTSKDLVRYWPMVRKAASFLVQNGPVTPQDRWEEDPGYSPFTLAVEISALLAAADLAELQKEPDSALYLRQTADTWNASIEHWIYATDTDLTKSMGVEGYYVRIAPPEEAEASSPAKGFVPIKNRPPDQSDEPASLIVSPDALALVRFGLRAPDDPRIVNTVKVIDALLKTETPYGPVWHRYNEDGYGEHEDGSPFDGTGIGRGWPLLTCERALYELAAGNRAGAIRLLDTVEKFSNEGGLLPEQIWDSPDIPERELYFGRPSGSAMPLVWAHSEYIKLRRSLKDGRIFDTPPQAHERYVVKKTGSDFAPWRMNLKCASIPAGKTLRIELLAPSIIRWSDDNWQSSRELKTRDTGLGIHLVDMPINPSLSGTSICFEAAREGDPNWQTGKYTILIV